MRIISHAIRLAYFGKATEPLSVFGLRTVLGTAGLEVVSVTCAETAAGSPDGPLTRLARDNGLPIRGFDEVRAGPPPDVVLSFSNSLIFRDPFLSSVPLGVINMHPAPIPRFRGSNGIEHCLLEDEPAFGATLHYCDARIDTGPVIAIETFPVVPSDNARDVWVKVDRAAERLLTGTLPAIVDAGLRGQRLPAVAQDESNAQFYRMSRLGEEMRLDPRMEWSALVARVRAWDHPRREPAYLPSGDRRLRLGWRHGDVVVLGVDEATEPAAEPADAVWESWNLLGELEDAYLQIAALQTARDLRLFETLAKSDSSPAELPGLLGASARGTRVIVGVAASLGLVHVDGDRVALSDAGRAYLDPASPAYYGDTLDRVTLSRSALGRLTEAVTSGQSLGHTGGDSGELWAQDIANSLVNWRHEARRSEHAWSSVTLPTGRARLVDLGCGSGTRTLPLLTTLPEATLECVDWHEAVLNVTRQVAGFLGVHERATMRCADLRSVEYPPASVDLIHASAVLYFYPVDELADLLKRVHRWLKPGGVFVSRHLYADDDRARAREALLRDLQMFLFHPDGYVPTRAETVEALRSAGFTEIRLVDGVYATARKPTE